MKKSFNRKELWLLYKYASKCKFILEVGSGRESTYSLAEAAKKNNAKIISIDVDIRNIPLIENVEFKIGWSVNYSDIIKVGEKGFIEHPDYEKFYKKRSFLDGRLAHKKFHLMKGETDLIRKSIEKTDIPLDFFFSDTGEYCGIAEWEIVKNKIITGGYFSCHDIYYPKSIKFFQVLELIEKDRRWEICVQTRSKRGLLIARKVL